MIGLTMAQFNMWSENLRITANTTKSYSISPFLLFMILAMFKTTPANLLLGSYTGINRRVVLGFLYYFRHYILNMCIYCFISPNRIISNRHAWWPRSVFPASIRPLAPSFRTRAFSCENIVTKGETNMYFLSQII